MNELVKHFVAAYVTTLVLTIAAYTTTDGFGMKADNTAPALLMASGLPHN
jgi:hypothetical protein